MPVIRTLTAVLFLPVFLLCLCIQIAYAAPPSVSLTEAEKAYVAQHPVIRVSNEMDFAPFDFSAGGQPYGYSIDVLNLLAKRVGLKLQYVNGYTWGELVDQFKAKELDLLHTINHTAERDAYGLFSQPYFRYKYHFIRRKGDPEIQYADDLVGKVVVIGRGWSVARYLDKFYPDIILHYVDTYEEMLEAVANGDADVTLSGEEAFRYTSRKLHLGNLAVSGWFKEFDLGRSRKYHFMTQKDAPELLSILDKGLATLTPRELDELRRKWFGPDSTYRPVVLLTAQEKIYLNSKTKVVFGVPEKFPPFVMQTANGQYSGYLYELTNMLSERTGLEIYLEHGAWGMVQELAKERQLDGLAAAAIHPVFEQDFIASPPFAHLMNFVYVKHGNPLKLRKQEDLKGLRVALLRHSHQSQTLINDITEGDAQIVWVDGPRDLIEAIISDKADYAVFSEAAIFIAEQLGMRSMIDPVFSVGRPLALAFQSRNDQPLLSAIIEKGLRSLTSEERVKLQRKWLNPHTVRAGETLLLTAEERRFLSTKGSLTMCGAPNWLPYQAIENGQLKGMAADYMNVLANRIGIDVHVIQTESWQDSLSIAREGVCDFLPMVKLTADRARYLDFTTPYLTLPNVIVARADGPKYGTLEDIRHKAVAVTRGYAVVSDLKDRYSDIHLLEYESSHQALQAVQSGQAEAYVGAAAAITLALARDKISDLEITGHLPWGYNLSIASRNDEPLLREIFQKAVDTLTSQDHSRIRDKWQAVEVQEVTDYSLLLIVLGAAAVVVGVVVVWNRQLHVARTRTEQALHDLSEARQLLEEQNKALENLSVTDRLTQLFNRTKLDEVLTTEVYRSARQNVDFSVIMLDLDHFKMINDTCGHKVGDLVLVELSKLLSGSLRMTDVAGRWGGEEFLILCPGANLQGSVSLAEKLRQQIEAHDFPVVQHVTASLGVATYRDKDTPDTLMDRADRALYDAKHRGRNLVSAENEDNIITPSIT